MNAALAATAREGARAEGAVAAVHECADSWRVVVVDGSPRRVLDAVTFRPGEASALEALLRRHRVRRVVRVAPGPRTLARCTSIPFASDAETASALRLIAEAELPETIPPHRRAAGIIPDLAREGVQTGLLTAWSGEELPSSLGIRGVDEIWTTVAASLAAIRGAGPLGVWLDRATGTIAILAGGPSRTVARVLVEDNSTPEDWRLSADRAIREACRSAGLEPEAGGGSTLRIGEAARAALSEATGGKSKAAAWLDEFGIALGAALTGASDRACIRSLAELSPLAPRRHRPMDERAVEWLAVRRNAWAALAAAVAALLVLPVGLAWARLAILESKVAGLRAQEESRVELARREALYTQLEKSRWPMTKLLADISGALPVGIEVRSIRLSPDQGLAVEASAPSTGEIEAFQANLNKPGIFRDVQLTRAEPGAAGGIEFEFVGAVVSPSLRAPAAEDYAATPLAVRLYGDGASNTHWNPGASASPPRPARAERRPAPEDRPDTEDDGGPEAPSRPSGSASEVPEAVSDEQIKAMDFNASMKAWVTRKTTLSKDKTLDQATKDRLTAEIDKLKVQMDAEKAKAAAKPPQ